MHQTHGWHVAALLLSFVLGTPLHAAPHRVVSTSLCTDEYVFRLVPRADIAALSFLAADRNPVVSTIVDRVKGITLIRPLAESVLTLAPDLAVLYQGTNPRLQAQLEKAGVAIAEIPWANSLDDVRRVTRMLGEKLGQRARAAALVRDMDAKLDAAHRSAPLPPVRTLIYEPNGYATSGGVSDEIMRISGLVNAASDMKPTRLGTIPVESVIVSAPELLILNGEREGHAARADLILRHPALRALKDESVVAPLALTPLLCPGPWSADVAASFVRLGQHARALAQAHVLAQSKARH